MPEQQPETRESRLGELLAEIRRYLETVELFREEGYEPCWRDLGPPVEAAR